MAELLVMAFDKTNPDSAIDARDCYKRGDIVRAVADGTCIEQPAPISANQPFYIFKVKNMDLTEAEQYVVHQSDLALTDFWGKPRRCAKRRYRIRLDDLPTSVARDLENDRWTTLARGQIINYVRDKHTSKDVE